MGDLRFSTKFIAADVQIRRWTLLAAFLPYLFGYLLPLAAQSDVPAAVKEKLTVQVKGQVVDDETGKPVTQMMIQAGRVDPNDPKKITWGYSERRTSSKTGRFRYAIRWSEGWTARVVVDGYLPQPIMLKAPKAGTTELNLVLRLKRGQPIRGRVVDHEGKPVAGANVFVVGPRGLNLFAGQAHDRYMDRIDPRAKSVATDKEGRFETHAGGAELLAVSTERFDVWTAKIKVWTAKIKPEQKEELEIKLPAPTKLNITVDIPGADEETEIFYQLLTHTMADFKNVQSTRKLKLKNGESLEITSLPPGRYQFCRSRMHRYENIGNGAMIDRTFLELKPGETKELRFVRKNGNRISGVVKWPEDVELAGVILRVESLEPITAPWDEREYTTTLDSRLVAGRAQVKVIPGSSKEFKTEALKPGKYKINVVAYTAMTPDEMRFTGIRAPNFTASKVVTVPETRELNMIVLELERAKR